MNGELVVGVDVGVSGARAAVVDERGITVGAGRAARPAGLGTPDEWLRDAGHAVRAACADARIEGGVGALAIGAFGPLPVLVDEDLQPVWTGELLSSDDPVRQVAAALARTEPTASAWQLDATGALVSALVGRPVMDRITAEDHRGSIVARPDPLEPTAIAGEVCAAAAGVIGVPAGTPVVVGTYDSFVDLRAIGAVDAGDAGLLVGSTLVLGVIADDAPAVPDGLRSVAHVGAGQFVGGWTSTAGSAIEWAADLLDHGDLADAAHDAGPGAGGLLALAHLDGERAPIWDDRARGLVLGLTARTDRIHLYRAVIDAVALAAADIAERLRPVSGEVARWRAAGGALRNVALAHSLADALGAPLDAFDLDSGRGAAVLALTALGHPIELAPACSIDPDPSRHARLAHLAEIRRGLYDTLADRLHALDALDAR
ncbi:MAG: FGGY-family carbohydrate kinase [Ilumatobacteraceae bacterium]